LRAVLSLGLPRRYPDVTPIPMPGNGTVKVALLAVRNASVVDCYNNAVPLSEVYNHHWIFNPVLNGQPAHVNHACPDTGLDFVVGVGAESRHSPTIWPDGHGYIVDVVSPPPPSFSPGSDPCSM
jgi:hypothetical protein